MSPRLDKDGAVRFQKDQAPLIVFRVDVILMMGIILVPMFGIIDRFLYPQMFSRFMSYRLLASLACLVLLLVNRRWNLGHKSLYLGVAAFYAVGLSIIKMILDLGGYSTPYYAGLNLVFIGFSVVIPVSLGIILLHCAALYLIYIGLVLLFSQPDNPALLISNNMFLSSALLIALTAAYINQKLRVREYLLRLDLERLRQKLERYSKGLEIKVRKKDQDLMRKMEELRNGRALLANTQRASIYGLAKLAESRDKSTGQHLERIQVYCVLIARRLSQFEAYQETMTEDYIAVLVDSCVLHDLGKVAIPDEILLKPDKLTPKEYDVIKTHAAIGGDTLGAIDQRLGEKSFIHLGREIAYFHHECYDGSGYPLGLRGQDIPLAARIVAVADVYDALTSNRCYREAMTHAAAVRLITNGRGSQFDPEVVDAFLWVQDLIQKAGQRIHEQDGWADQGPARSAASARY